MLQRISIIYLPLEPKLEIIRNIFRKGFDLLPRETENISAPRKLQMDEKRPNIHKVRSFRESPLTQDSQYGRNAAQLKYILMAASRWGLGKGILSENGDVLRIYFARR